MTRPLPTLLALALVLCSWQAGSAGAPLGEALSSGAAQAAGMGTVAVEYGYHSGGEAGPRSWNADRVIARPLDLIPYL